MKKIVLSTLFVLLILIILTSCTNGKSDAANETEQIFVKRLSERLRKAVDLKEYDVAIIESASETNPFQGL